MALRNFPHIVGKHRFIERHKHLFDVVRVLARGGSDGEEGGVSQRQSALVHGVLGGGLHNAGIYDGDLLNVSGHLFYT
jgi:hypothetical protein